MLSSAQKRIRHTFSLELVNLEDETGSRLCMAFHGRKAFAERNGLMNKWTFGGVYKGGQNNAGDVNSTPLVYQIEFGSSSNLLDHRLQR
jgi:hypothetical protein